MEELQVHGSHLVQSERGSGMDPVQVQYEALIPALEQGKTVSIPLEGDLILEMTPVCEAPESGGIPLVDARVIQVHGESRGSHPEQALRWLSRFFESQATEERVNLGVV